MKYIAIILLAVSVALFVVHFLANKVFGFRLRLKTLLWCAGFAVFLSAILPKLIMNFVGLHGALALLAVAAIIFSYVVAFIDDSVAARHAEDHNLRSDSCVSANSTSGLQVVPQPPFAHFDDLIINNNREGMDSKAATLAKKFFIQEQREMLSEYSNRKSEEDTSIEKPIVSLAEEDTSIEEPIVPLAEEDTSIEEPIVPLAEEDTSIEEPIVPLAEEDTSIEEPIVSLAEEDTSIEEPIVSLAEEDTSIEEPIVPLAEEDTSIEEPIVPLAEEDTSIEEPIVPLAEEDTSIEEPIVPLAEEDTSIEESIVPLAEEGTSIEESIVPLAEEGTPVEKPIAPLAEEKTFAEELVKPLSQGEFMDDGSIVSLVDGDGMLMNTEITIQDVQCQSDSLDDLMDFAFAQKEQHNLRQALKAFQKALKLYHDSEAAPFLIAEMGGILKEQGLYEDAIIVLSKGRDIAKLRFETSLEEEFIDVVAYLRIVKNALLEHRLGFIPFKSIPASIIEKIDSDFSEWRKLK